MLPAQIGNLSECLRILDVDNNQIDSFPESFSSLGRLIQLTAAHNKFTEFPAPLLPLYGLEKLDLRMNQVFYILYNYLREKMKKTKTKLVSD